MIDFSDSTEFRIRKVHRKPVEVQSVHATVENIPEIVDWIVGQGFAATLGEGQLIIQTIEAPATVRPGDYVVYEPSEGFVKVDADVYAATYDDPEQEERP
jgi:hypothetical protein